MKNWRGTEPVDAEQPDGGIMPAKPGDRMCPVAAFELYVSKLPSDRNDRLFLQPKLNCRRNDSIWYTAMPWGKNSLGDFMRNLSRDAELSKMYLFFSFFLKGTLN